MNNSGDEVIYKSGSLTEAQFLAWLQRADGWFVPKLSDELVLENYAEKIARLAVTFEAWHDGQVAGIFACYCNDPKKAVAFITHGAVSPEYKGHDLARQLMGWMVEQLRLKGFQSVDLEVRKDNVRAQRCFEKSGFEIADVNREGPSFLMRKQLA